MFDITPKELRALVEKGLEPDFILVDIRRQAEYELDHIPGAVHMSVGDMDMALLTAKPQRKVILYCRVGRRSKAAVLLAMDAGVPPENILHLQGGIMAYEGEILMDIPRLDIFDPDLPVDAVMEKAMNLEKGAFLFYQLAAARFENTPIHSVMAGMCGAEIAHAKAIFKRLRNHQPSAMGFDVFFEQLEGNVLEGGKPLEEIRLFVGRTGPEQQEDILDLALEVEYTAYDLYRVMSEKTHAPVLKEMFLSLAQAEKKHLDQIVRAIDMRESL